MTAYVAVQKALCGVSFNDDVELLNKSIRVLTYCALRDSLASKFQKVLETHLDTLYKYATIASKDSDDTRIQDTPMAEILFTRHEGASELHVASSHLLHLTHQPFSSFPAVSAEATLSNRAETTMGTHLEWEWELKGGQCTAGAAKPKEACGMSSDCAPEASAKLQPQGGPWSMWTPPAWDKAFSS